MKELKVLEDIIGLKFQYYNTINLNSSVTVTGPPDSNGPGTTGTNSTRDINTLNNTNNTKDINTIKNIEENSTIQIAAPKVATVTKDTKGSSSTVNEDITGSGPDTVMGVIILNKYNIIIIYNKNEIKFYNINNIINTLQFNNLLFKLYFNNIINIITSETVLGPPDSTTTRKGANSTLMECTSGKGANSTAMECTSEKILNEIAAVTNSGESDTFSMDTNTKGTEDIEVDLFRAVGEVDPLGAAVGPSTVTEDNILIELENEILIYNIKKLKIILKYKKMKKKLYKYKLINNLLIIIYENKLKIYKINQLIFFHQFNFNITFLSNFFQNYFILIDQYNHLYYLEISNTVLGHTASNEPDINSNKDITVVPGTNTLTTSNTNSNKDIGTIGPSTVTTGKGANFTATECTPGKGANSTLMECTTTNTTITEEKNLNEIAVVTKTGESGTFSVDSISKDIKDSEGVDERVVYIEEDVVGASTVMVKLMEIELKNYEDYKIISLYIYNNNIIISLYNNIDFLLLITKLSNNQLIILYYSFNELFIEYNNMEGNLGENNGNLGNLEGNLGENNGNLGNLEGNLENSENLVNTEVDVDNLEINYYLFENWNILLIYSNKSISTLLITNNINLINYNIMTSETVLAPTATTGKGANSMVTECTPGKGANSTLMECTSEKNINEIAVVTNFGESSTFSVDSKDTVEISKTPSGGVGEGTTDRGPHTVTEEYIIIKLYEGYNIESIEYEDYIKLILLYTNYENEIYRKNSLADTPTMKNPNVIFTLQNSNTLSIYFIDIYFGYNFTDHILTPVTVLGQADRLVPGTKDIDTIGASSVTEEKVSNEIAVVTKIGESSTFSEDITSKDIKVSEVDPYGVPVGASTVTEEKLKYLYKNNVYKENIKLYESLLNILYNFHNNIENNNLLRNGLVTVENIENTVEIIEISVENISLNKINEYIIIIKNLLNIQNNFNYILENNIKPVTVTSTTGKGANSMGMECTMDSKDITGKGATTTVGASTVTEELKKLVNKNINIKIEINEINKLEEIIFYINQQLKFLYKKLFNIPLRCLVTTNNTTNKGKGANDTFNDPGKRANNTFTTQGKGANFTAIECTSEKITNEIAAVTKTGESSTFSVDSKDTSTKDTMGTTATEETGTVGPGCREPHSVTEELNEKLYNLINDIKLLYNKPLKINNNIKLYKFITLFNSSNTVLAPTNSTPVPGSTTNITLPNSTNTTTVTEETGAVGPSTVTEENSTTIAAPKVGTTVLTGPLGTKDTKDPTGPSTVTKGKGANDTFTTPGKGANFTATECTIGPSTVTEEKISNEIAVVTKSGESSNNIDRVSGVSGVNTGVISTGAITKEAPFRDKVAPFGASTDGTSGRGPDTVTENIFGNMELNKELNNPILFNTQITQTKQLNNISIFSTFNNYQSLYDLANQFNTVTGTNTGFSNTSTGFSNTSTGFTGGFTGSNTGFGNTSTGFTGGFTGFTGGFSNTKETPFGVKETPFGVKETPFGVKETPFGVKESPFGVKESPFGSVGTTTNGVVGRGPDTVTENIWTGIRKYDPLN